jgi:K+-transporting ATPase ATPase C chain
MLRPALVLLAAFTVLTGVAYTVAMTGIAGVIFPRQAGGSVVADHDGAPAGSGLVGQPFSDPRWFWGRPSATAPVPYDGRASAGSNLGPSNPALHDAVKARIAALREADPGSTAPVPVDLVTASGSGLDPHISPAAALYQVPRVSRARGIAPERVRALVQERIERPTLGILGAPRVNVLELNLALDAIAR